MNKALLKSVMTRFNDTQAVLAGELGLSLSRFNAKLNEYHGAAFTQNEITCMIRRYALTPEQALEIFFA